MGLKQDIRLAVDAVIFGYKPQNSLSILLIKRKYEPYQNHWALPGGFVLNEESLEQAVQRELEEETGAKVNYLEQLYTFGAPGRDPRGRVVSTTYFGLVRPEAYKIIASTDAEDVNWFDINSLPELAFDHSEIIKLAKNRLQGKLKYEPIGFELLDEAFAFSDLENLYSTVLEKTIDRRNFRKKILSYELLIETKEKVANRPGRPASMYKFDKARYDLLKERGMSFEI